MSSTVQIQTPDVVFDFEEPDDTAAAHVIFDVLQALATVEPDGLVVVADSTGLPVVIRADQILSIYIAEENNQ